MLVLERLFSFKCIENSFQRTTCTERRTIDKTASFTYTDDSLLDIAMFVKEREEITVHWGKTQWLRYLKSCLYKYLNYTV